MTLATLASTAGAVQFSLEAYQIVFSSKMENAQLHHGVQYYPIKVLQGDFEFTAHFKSEQEFIAMQNLIHAADKVSITPGTAFGGPLRLSYPGLGIDYQGFIKSSQEGVKKWDYSPMVNYSMILTQDSIYTPTAGYTNVGAFQNIYGGGQTNVGGAVNALNPPSSAGPGVSGGGPDPFGSSSGPATLPGPAAPPAAGR